MARGKPSRAITTKAPYVYCLGAVGRPKAHQRVMDLHAEFRDDNPALAERLASWGRALWVALHGTTAEECRAANPGPAPAGFTYRVLRLTAADYRSIMAQANAGARRFRHRDAVHVRYIRKIAGDDDGPAGWAASPWVEGVNLTLSENPEPLLDPFAPPPPLETLDGQHRHRP